MCISTSKNSDGVARELIRWCMGRRRRPNIVLLALALSIGGCASSDLTTAAPVGAEALGYAPTTYTEHVQALKWVSVDGQNLAYLDLGEGPVVLLVHGVPTSSWAYRKVAADLVMRGYRVIAPDLLGYGASDKTTKGEELDPEQQGARLLGLMDTLQVEDWIQVVHDAGGPWSFTMLPHAKDRIRGLVLLNTVLFEDGWNPPLKFKEGSGMGRMVLKALSGPHNDRWARVTVGKGTEDRAIRRDEGLVEGYRAPLSDGAAFSVQQFIFRFRAMCEGLPTYQESLVAFTGPIGVVWGMKDDILDGKKQLRQLRALEGLDDLTIRELNKMNHFVQEEAPLEVSSMVVEVSKLIRSR